MGAYERFFAIFGFFAKMTFFAKKVRFFTFFEKISFFLIEDTWRVWNILVSQEQKSLYYTLLRWGVRWLEILTGIIMKTVNIFRFGPFFLKILRILAKTWFLKKWVTVSRKFSVLGPGFHFWLLAKPWKVVNWSRQIEAYFVFFTFFSSLIHFFHFFGHFGQKMTKITFFCQFLTILVIFDILKNDHFWDIFWRPFFGHFEVVQIWLAKLELFPGFLENPKKGSKKWP